jgi:hypothetical protein
MRRRAAQAASAASAQALSLRAMRPLLFVLVSLFLVLPMLVYNFATLDAAQIRRWTESVNGGVLRDALLRHVGDKDDGGDAAAAIAGLPRTLRKCAAVSRTTNVSTTETVDAVIQQCFTPDKTTQPASSDMVHFVYLPVHMVPLLKGEPRPPMENFTMAQFAAVEAVRKHVKPSLMVLHYPATEPRAYWYTQCQRHLSLHRVLFPKLPAKTTPSSLSVYQRRDIMQVVIALGALRTHGGVAFTDFNTLVLRPTRLLRQLPLVLGRSRGKKFAVSPAMLTARAGNGHVAFLETELLRMLQTDDERLRRTPLDQLLGEILVESVAKASGDAIPNVVLTAPSVLDAFHDADVLDLVASTPTATQLKLRESVAIHLPVSQATHRSGHAAMVQLETQWKDFETLEKAPSLLGAVMRFAISLNQTSELDGVLQR